MDGLAERLTEVARYYLSIGLTVIPLGRDKRPAIKWGDHIEQPLEKWEYPGCNIALITGHFNGLVVVDCDSEDSYIGWLKTKPQTPLRVKTKRGMQFYYRHPGIYVKSDSHIKDPSGFEYDVKGDRSYVVAPPSVRSGHQYQFLVCSSNIRGKLIPFSQLPQFDPEWRPERPQLQQCQGARTAVSGANSWQTDVGLSVNDSSRNIHDNMGRTGRIANGVRYIETIKPVGTTLGGAGRDKDVYRAACKLVESGLNSHEVERVMVQWNQTNVTPPLPTGELMHKINRAFMQAK